MVHTLAGEMGIRLQRASPSFSAWKRGHRALGVQHSSNHSPRLHPHRVTGTAWLLPGVLIQGQERLPEAHLRRGEVRQGKLAASLHCASLE